MAWFSVLLLYIYILLLFLWAYGFAYFVRHFGSSLVDLHERKLWSLKGPHVQCLTAVAQAWAEVPNSSHLFNGDAAMLDIFLLATCWQQSSVSGHPSQETRNLWLISSTVIYSADHRHAVYLWNRNRMGKNKQTSSKSARSECLNNAKRPSAVQPESAWQILQTPSEGLSTLTP